MDENQTKIVRRSKGFKTCNKNRHSALSKIERANLPVKAFGQIMCVKSNKNKKKRKK